MSLLQPYFSRFYLPKACLATVALFLVSALCFIGAVLERLVFSSPSPLSLSPPPLSVTHHSLSLFLSVSTVSLGFFHSISLLFQFDCLFSRFRFSWLDLSAHVSCLSSPLVQIWLVGADLSFPLQIWFQREER